MVIVDFHEMHLDYLDLQEKQKFFSALIQDKLYGVDLKEMGQVWSLIDENNLKCIGCGGIINVGFGRGIAWSLLSKDSAKYMTRITKAVILQLNNVDYNRIEITAEDGFEEAHRWAKMLGFKLETPDGMENYCNGKKHYLYARVR